MALLVPYGPGARFTADNWGANPSATPGTSITPGGSGAEGTYAEIISDTVVTEDIFGMSIRLSDMRSHDGRRQQLLRGHRR